MHVISVYQLDLLSSPSWFSCFPAQIQLKSSLNPAQIPSLRPSQASLNRKADANFTVVADSRDLAQICTNAHTLPLRLATLCLYD
jgi:hypothetical protein